MKRPSQTVFFDPNNPGASPAPTGATPVAPTNVTPPDTDFGAYNLDDLEVEGDSEDNGEGISLRWLLIGAGALVILLCVAVVFAIRTINVPLQGATEPPLTPVGEVEQQLTPQPTPTQLVVVQTATLGHTATPLPPMRTQIPSTATPTLALPATATPRSGATQAAAPAVVNVSLAGDEWDVEAFPGAPALANDWLTQLKNLEPALWPKFPNENNPDAEFVSANGLFYGEDESGYCDADEHCDIVVPPNHYRIVTGDYVLPFHACKGGGNKGCGFIAFSVGREATNIDDVSVDFGFTIWGEYFNGSRLGESAYAAMSHVGGQMLNLFPMIFNVNRGGNCSKVDGCPTAELSVFFLSGNELLLKAVTTVGRP